MLQVLQLRRYGPIPAAAHGSVPARLQGAARVWCCDKSKPGTLARMWHPDTADVRCMFPCAHYPRCSKRNCCIDCCIWRRQSSMSLEECKPSKVVLNTVSVRAGMLCSQKFVHLDNCIFRRCSFRSSSASDSKDFMALEYELLQQVRKLGA